MVFSVDLYERTIVFVQRMENEKINNFSRYADLDNIVQTKAIPNIDLDKIEFGDGQGSLSRSLTFPNINVRVVGQFDRLLLSMEDVAATDEYFYEVARRYCDILAHEDVSAIGINFNGIVETDKAVEIIKEKILNQCSPEILNSADGASFKLVHEDKDKQAFFTISIDAGAIKSASTKRDGLLIACNYHREIKGKQLMKKKLDEFKQSLEKINDKFEYHKEKIEGFLNE